MASAVSGSDGSPAPVTLPTARPLASMTDDAHIADQLRDGYMTAAASVAAMVLDGTLAQGEGLKRIKRLFTSFAAALHPWLRSVSGRPPSSIGA
ncbi:MAG TPA: hypothetical protein VKE74_29965 [Gemmataceae bacterium]|nr:hypothetical protein [Gemmataceae bacterium]